MVEGRRGRWVGCCESWLSWLEGHLHPGPQGGDDGGVGKSLVGCGDPAALQRAERAADHFAACLLMPKRWVKRLWGEGTQTITQMAAAFGVSHQAMRYRLDQLGLVEPPERCRPDATRYQRTRMEVAA